MAPRRIRRIWSALKQATQEWQADDGPLLAASIAYYAALSFFPLLLCLIAGLGLFLQFTDLGKDAEQQVLDFISAQVSPELEHQVQDALTQVRERAGIGGPIGLATLLLAALVIFAQLESAFDRIWSIKPPEGRGLLGTVKHLLVNRFKAFLMLLGLGLLVVVTFVAGMVLTGIQNFAEGIVPTVRWMWTGAQVIMGVTINALILTLIYKLLPKPRIQWTHALAGGVFAAVTWEIGRQILAAFLIGNKYTSAYGVVGSFIGIMLWIYYASAVLFLGAEFVQVLGKRPQA